MKKIKYRLVALLLALFVLCGCMRINVQIKVDKQLNAQLSGSVYISKTFLNDSKSAHNFLGKLFPFFVLSEKSEEDKIINGDAYNGFKFKIKSSVFDKHMQITKENNKIHFFLSAQVVNDIKKEMSVKFLNSKVSLHKLVENGLVSANVVISMPNKVTSSSCGEIKAKDVSVNLLDSNLKDIDIYCSANNNHLLWLAGGIIVASIILIKILLIRRKKA